MTPFLINLILLVGGSSVLAIATLLYLRERAPLLHTYIITIAVWTFNQIILIAFLYVNEVLGIHDETVNRILNDASYASMGMFTLWLPRLIHGLFQVACTRRDRRFYTAASTIILMPILWLQRPDNPAHGLISVLELIKVLLFYIIIYRMAFFMLRMSNRVANPDVRRFLRGVFSVQMVFYPIMIYEGRGYFSGEHPFGISSFAVYYFLVNLVTLTYASRYLRFPELRMIDDREAVAAFSRTYNVSKREAEVISLLIQGRSYKRIAAALFISPETVKTHVNNIYRKTNVTNKMELAALIRRYDE